MSTNHNLFEERGRPKWYRTEVLLLTSLTPYRQAKPTHLGAFGADYIIYIAYLLGLTEVRRRAATQIESSLILKPFATR